LSAAAKRLVIRGQVQGVGYRGAAVHAAFALGVIGWVRNRRDGYVEALAQGEPEAIERFVAWCRRGPPLALVVEITAFEAQVDTVLSGFEVRATA
jgi:acylphosphatase